jgi:hypothetical protein
MVWLIVLLGLALVVYRYGVPSAHTRRAADKAAGGAAGGARKATNAHFRRRDLAWGAGFVLAAFLFLWGVFSDDDTPAPATETAASAEAAETAEATPTTETVSSPLSFGDSGPDVVILQEHLAAVGLPVTVDGVYGQETADAVMAFQEREQLIVDGVLGSETGEALGIWSG